MPSSNDDQKKQSKWKKEKNIYTKKKKISLNVIFNFP
jgi:hypothetical protein